MRSFIFHLSFILISLPLVSAESLLEKVDLDDPQDVYLESLNNMKATNWEGALEILTAFTGKHKPEKALKEFGPKFGWFWYHKGYCEEKMGNHKDAINSYERCYTDYPNAPDAKSKNTFQVYALYKWGECAFEEGDFESAKTQFEKFLAERDPKKNPQEDKFPKGKFYVNQAISYFKTGDVEKGMEALRTAVENRDEFLTPPSAIFSGFDALTEACIAQNNEQTIIDFLKKYKKDLLADVFVTSQYSKLLISRAKNAINAKMSVVPLELISLVPNTQTAINDLKAQLKSFKGFSADNPIRDGYILISPTLTEKLVDKLETEMKGEEGNEALCLALSAYLWSSSGNNRASYAAYKELEARYPQSKNRESSLFNLIQAANNIGKVAEAEEYGKTFLRAFPESEQAGAVRKVMVTSLYYDKNYQQCIKVAGDQYDELEATKPSEAHDTCLYVLGGSYYYTGQFEEAAKYLSQHVKEYPESKHLNDSMFLEASNLSRLQQFVKAGEKLDAYLNKFKDAPNHLYPYALYDRANCHYSLQEFDKALERIKSLEEGYLSSRIMDAAFNLKGSILYSQEDDDRAESYYKRGLEAAKKNGNKGTAGESLSSLVMMLADPQKKGEDRSGDALAFYDEFWKQYAEGSPFQANVAVAGFPAMKKAGRAEEGLEKMKLVISKVAKLPGQPMLENLVNSYTEAYLEVNTADQLKEHFYNFDGVDAEDKEALALLRIALVGAYEDEIKDAKSKKEEAKATQLSAGVKAIFNDLKNDFNPAILTPFTLNKIADYIRKNTATPREAVTYYNEVINRGNQEFMLNARFGLADIYGNSGQAAEKAKASALLTEIYNAEDASNKDKSRALFRLIELHVANEEWAEANAKAIEYADNKSFSADRAMASYIRALSYDKLGKEAEALQAYIKVNAVNLANMTISAPSTKRIMELFWKRNQPAVVDGEGNVTTMSDRQGAYNQGWTYIDATRRHLPKMTEEHKALWQEVEALVKKYESSGEIIDMETQKAKKK